MEEKWVMLREVVDDFIDAITGDVVGPGGSSASTIVAYKSDLHQFCSYVIARNIVSWAGVMMEDMDEYVRLLSEGHGYKESTVVRKISACRAFFCYLQGREMIAHDPTAALHLSPGGRELCEPLSKVELICLLQQMESETATGLRDLAMCHVLYATGLLTSHLLSLDKHDFDVRHALLRCPGPGRGERRGERVCNLSDEAAQIIVDYLRLARPCLVRSSEEQALFVSGRGTRLTRQGFWLIMREHAQRAGIVHFSAHSLRLSFTALRESEKMNPRTLYELLEYTPVSPVDAYDEVALLRDVQISDL